MTPPPRLSVIIPTLNEEKLLDAMLRQFTPELRMRFGVEVIVSDGGSADQTLAIARAHDCVVVENPSGAKQTISLGRNLGARRASGEVLVFLNADTLLDNPSRFFTRMLEELRASSPAALTCSVGVYPEEERTADRLFHGFTNWLFAMMNVIRMGMGRGECHVMTRSAFARVGGYAPHIAAGEDYDMFRRLKELGRIRFLHDVRVFESPRRYRTYGYLRVSASWFLNFLAVFFFRRSILSEWKPVR